MRGFAGLYWVGLRFLSVAFNAKVVRSAKNTVVTFHDSNALCSSAMCHMIHFNPYLQHLSTQNQSQIPWEGSTHESLLTKLETALQDDNVDEAWEAFNNLKRLHGFPKQNLVSRLVISLSYSSDKRWLHKAYDFVLTVLKEKPDLLHHESLTGLVLTLVRAQMPRPASTILRIMLEKRKFPSIDISCTMFFHLVKTQIGSYLATNILIEICESFLLHRSDIKTSRKLNLIKPNLTIFNIVLDSCAKFGSTLKAQQIIELMPQVGVVADANTIIMIARIYEMIGQRDELKNLKEHIDGVSSMILDRHYRQFYDCLLSLHFKYNDIDAAAELVLDLYRRPKTLHSSHEFCTQSKGLQKHCLVQIGSGNLRMGYKIMVEPMHLENEFVVDAQSPSGLILFTDGKLVPSEKALAKLINGYVKERKVGKLSNLLVSIQKETGFKKVSLCSDVIDACVQLGWLNTAHDIIDDLEAAGIFIHVDTYISLLRAYYKENMLEESKVLLKQIRKVGVFVDMSNEHAISTSAIENSALVPLDKRAAASCRKSHLVEFLDPETRAEDSENQLVYEFNTSVRFFCKAKMMEDALKTYKQMRQRNVQPTVQTFINLVSGYSSLKLFREITILWGEIRRQLEDGTLTPNRDLFECLLLNFLVGGYFERVMEISSYVVKYNLYIDKWKYKREFLKLHKHLYHSLHVSHTRTDAQRMRLEHVQAFRRWVGIDH